MLWVGTTLSGSWSFEAFFFFNAHIYLKAYIFQSCTQLNTVRLGFAFERPRLIHFNEKRFPSLLSGWKIIKSPHILIARAFPSDSFAEQNAPIQTVIGSSFATQWRKVTVMKTHRALTWRQLKGNWPNRLNSTSPKSKERNVKGWRVNAWLRHCSTNDCGYSRRVNIWFTYLKNVTKNWTRSIILLCWEKAIYGTNRRECGMLRNTSRPYENMK